MSQPCPRCTSSDLLVVHLTPVDTPMRFSTCRHCEHRWWEEAGSGTDVPLRLVIDDLQAAS